MFYLFSEDKFCTHGRVSRARGANTEIIIYYPISYKNLTGIENVFGIS